MARRQPKTKSQRKAEADEAAAREQSAKDKKREQTPAEKDPQWEMNYETGVYTSSRGTELTVLPISPHELDAMVVRVTSKVELPPEVPKKVIPLAGGATQTIQAGKDPDYLEALVNHNRRTRHEAIIAGQDAEIFLFNEGIKENPPEEWVENRRIYMPDLSDIEAKRLWVLAQLMQLGESNILSDIIQGQEVPTASGLNDAADEFQADDEREADLADV